MDLQGSWRNPGTLQAQGHAAFTEGAILYQGMEVVSGLSAPCEINDVDCRATFAGQALGGPLFGQFTLRHEGLTASQLHMNVHGARLQLGTWADRFPRWKAFSHSSVLPVCVRRRRTAVQDIHGKGVIHVENADVRVLPVIARFWRRSTWSDTRHPVRAI